MAGCNPYPLDTWAASADFRLGGGKETWEKAMKVYLAQEVSWEKEIRLMDIYLAGDRGKEGILQEKANGGGPLSHINILESFYYLRGRAPFMKLAKEFGSFLLDSGAFTFLQGSHRGKVDWDAYTEEYAAFINRHEVSLFFELDIDSIVGLKEVERLRDKLERLTNRRPIPVWHYSRGKEYFLRMCREYPYVALGGIVTREVPRRPYEEMFPWFILQAHNRGAKIHGLGYTNIQGLHRYHFDSVDSSSWLYGNRSGYVYVFDGNHGAMRSIHAKPGYRLKAKEGAIHNFNEWVKFTQYAKEHL